MADLNEDRFSVGMREAGVALEFDNESALHMLDLAEARALRDWLNAALPCEHKRTFTGYVRVDPFGKSDAMREVKNQCLDCGHPYFTASPEAKGET